MSVSLFDVSPGRLELMDAICFCDFDFIFRSDGFLGQSGVAKAVDGRNDADRSVSDCCGGIFSSLLSDVREIVILGGGSRFRSSSGPGDEIVESDCLEIRSETEAIGYGDFRSRISVGEVTFASNSRCRMIDGFAGFCSLRRIMIPRSVEIIRCQGFSGCTSLREVIFEQKVISSPSRDFRNARHSVELSFHHPLNSSRCFRNAHL
jgi:hypothetical protein